MGDEPVLGAQAGSPAPKSDVAPGRPAQGNGAPEPTCEPGKLRHDFANTLQIVTGLIRLRHARAPSDEVRRELGWVQDAVAAIALLYRTGSGGRTNLAEFLAAFVECWRPLCGERRIRIELDAPSSLTVPERIAMPIALIVHELVANAWRHAFPDGRQGRIAIRLFAEGGWGVLEVADDGAGRRDGAQRDGLGAELLPRLAAQAGGAISIQAGAGTLARLHVPLA